MVSELVYIAVGSNIDPGEHIPPAVTAVANSPGITLNAISSFYISDAEGRPEQPQYRNGVIAIETDIPPEILKFDVLRPIETAQGRIRTEDRYAPRTIDLDIILYKDLELHSGSVKVPDSAIWQHPFVTIPLLEIAPTICIPGLAGDLATHAPTSPESLLKVDNSLTHLLQKGLLHG
ncbi:MAG: 2-amino-4-hydroxy-6-hydroxymethyldihydropteridine diphosphokinase [Candidatus Hydrogenedentota bacterium]